MKQTDVVVVGAGILGCFAARALRRYDLSVDVLERSQDVCEGITRANTGIIYTQNSTIPDTVKNTMSMRASRHFAQLCADLDVPFSRCGYLYVSFGPNGNAFVEDKYRTSLEQGDTSMRLMTGGEARRIEEALSPSVTEALLDPNVGTVDPWCLGIAAYENARANGAVFHMEEELLSMRKADGAFELETDRGTYRCSAVLNCAGLQADVVREMVLPPMIRIRPRAADYYVLDPRVSGLISHIISQEREDGKGVTLVPTVDGNILAGPTNRHTDIRSLSFPTEEAGLANLSSKCAEVIPSFPFDAVIRNFGAIRPNTRYGHMEDGLWIPEDKNIPGFPILEEEGLFSLIGIKTPGITCSEELGIYMADRISEYLGGAPRNAAFDPIRRAIPHPASMTDNERAELIRANPDYGEIICRCRQITKGEIIEAIDRGAVSIEGVRRRVGAGMGRCQGGFCREKVTKLLAESKINPSGFASGHDDPAAAKGSLRTSGLSTHYDILVIGAGAAGMAAALTASRRGQTVLLVDRAPQLGGILNQCIHDGFGLGYFKENLTGTEYAKRFSDRVNDLVSFSERDTFALALATTVLRIEPDRSALLSSARGLHRVSFDQCILATGCRERAIGSLGISGTRPHGIYTAGEMQKMINVDHMDIGRDIIVLGSGDIGQIVARRMVINGKNIVAMVEKEDHPGGIKLNHERCIKAHHLPLMLRSTVVEIIGEKDLEAVVVEHLDTKKRTTLPCDTLITAVGLIPERELLADLPAIPSWIHSVGNCDYVHEIVDSVSLEAEKLIESLV